MLRQFVLISILASFAVLNAWTPATAAPAEEEEVDEKEITRSVELDGLVFPIFENRKLKNYIFVTARMKVASGKSTWVYREQGHTIRDAIIRASHRVSLHQEGDIHSLDLERTKEILLKAANESVGETEALVDMTFVQVESKLGF